jgi:hypothetical protein
VTFCSPRIIRAGSLLRFLCLALCLAAPARAQTPLDPARKFEITDNSFLVEEAFNQEEGVFQNIATWTWSRDGEWNASFTQEWPAPGMAHQLSYTIPLSRAGGRTGVNDVLLNYRYQWATETATHPAVSPRVSLVLPTGDAEAMAGSGRVGLELNLPASKQVGDWYLHGNVGVLWLPHVALNGADRMRATLTSPRLAASGIWRAAPMVNLMLEAVIQFEQSIADGREVIRERGLILSPGLRRGWNVGDRQIVVGAAVPFTAAGNGPRASVLTYFSYELPFK